jgi:fatty acid desaturase
MYIHIHIHFKSLFNLFATFGWLFLFIIYYRFIIIIIILIVVYILLLYIVYYFIVGVMPLGPYRLNKDDDDDDAKIEWEPSSRRNLRIIVGRFLPAGYA